MTSFIFSYLLSNEALRSFIRQIFDVHRILDKYDTTQQQQIHSFFLLLSGVAVFSSLLPSLIPETNPLLTLVKDKIPQLLYKNTTGWAQSNPAAGESLSSPHFYWLHVCSPPLFTSLTQPCSPLAICCLLSALPLLRILLCMSTETIRKKRKSQLS